MRAKFKGQNISNPILIIAAAMFAIVGCVLFVPLHPIFRLFGRRGIIRRSFGGGYEIIVDATSFERV